MMIDLPALIEECAPFNDSYTVQSIIMTESKAEPYAIHDNTTGKSYTLTTKEQAVSTAKRALRKGHNIDLGLMQVNSKNLSALNLSLEGVFEPCTNISSGASIFNIAYRQAIKTHGSGNAALLHAISAYNMGSSRKIYNTKYVNAVMQNVHVLQVVSLSD